MPRKLKTIAWWTLCLLPAALLLVGAALLSRLAEGHGPLLAVLAATALLAVLSIPPLGRGLRRRIRDLADRWADRFRTPQQRRLAAVVSVGLTFGYIVGCFAWGPPALQAFALICCVLAGAFVRSLLLNDPPRAFEAVDAPHRREEPGFRPARFAADAEGRTGRA